MKGDFSRIGFDAKNHYSQVLLQQGRVTLDADPNEQGAILLHYLRTLARDLIGPCGGPADALGFGLTLADNAAGQPTLTIGAGRYYVDGILVENDADCDYALQPDRVPPADDPLLQRLKTTGGDDDVWLYLDVWERHVSWIENDAIRESALGGPDTCTRAQVVWQVRSLTRTTLLERLKAKQDALDSRLADTSLKLTPPQRAALEAERDKIADDIKLLNRNAAGQPGNDCAAPLGALGGIGDGRMAARLDPGQQPKDPCVVAPDARYRGVENHLYRVEVHRGSAPGVTPTFKWSRDNGSVATRWLGTEGNDLVVMNARGFAAGVWVELADESTDALGESGVLVQVTNVSGDRLTIDPASVPAGGSTVWRESLVKPKVRRWDQAATDDTVLMDGAVPIVEASATDPQWLDLEDGIQVRFAAGGSAGVTYRSGDYWLIPARVASGGIEWPGKPGSINGEPDWQTPRGVEHHYAPLGFVGMVAGKLATTPCVCTIEPIGDCAATREPQAGAASPARKRPAGAPKASVAAPPK